MKMDRTKGDLRQRLGATIASGSPGERAIAAYLLGKLAELPFETAASLAAKTRVSEVSIGRFARALGYRNLKDMKAALDSTRDLSNFVVGGDSPWLHGVALHDRFAAPGARAAEMLSLEREIRAVMRNHELVTTPEFAACAERLAHAPHVFVAGFQTERGMAQYLVHNLAYLRPWVRLIEGDSGHYAELLLDAPAGSALVVIETRRYSRLAAALVDKAHAAGLAVTMITDPYCAWAIGSADEILRVDTDLNHFWDATAQIASLINLLVNRVFELSGPGVEDRLNAIARSFSEFVGHTR